MEIDKKFLVCQKKYLKTSKFKLRKDYCFSEKLFWLFWN